MSVHHLNFFFYLSQCSWASHLPRCAAGPPLPQVPGRGGGAQRQVFLLPLPLTTSFVLVSSWSNAAALGIAGGRARLSKSSDFCLSPLASFLLPAFPPFLFHAHVFLLRPRPKLPLQYPGPRLELGSYPGAHTLHPALMPVLGSIYPADTSTPLTCGL